MKKQLKFLILMLTLTIAFGFCTACSDRVETSTESNSTSGDIEQSGGESSNESSQNGSSEDSSNPDEDETEGGGDWTGTYLPD